jgi:hypothetical protein
MRKLLYLTAVAAIALVSLGFLTKSMLFQIRASSLQPPATATISIDELHRSIDMKALPVQEIKDPI